MERVIKKLLFLALFSPPFERLHFKFFCGYFQTLSDVSVISAFLKNRQEPGMLPMKDKDFADTAVLSSFLLLKSVYAYVCVCVWV